jgi:hypothetical protein
VRGALAIVATVLMLAAGRGAAAQRLPGTTLPMLSGVNPKLLLLEDRKGVRERYAGSMELESMATRLRRDAHQRDAAGNAWVWFFVAGVGNAAMLASLLVRLRRTSAER